MKQNTIINLATIAVLFAVSCTEIENPANVGGPADIIVTIDQENGTKATLSDGDGSFRFTPGDEIRVHNGTAAYTGTTVSNSNSGAFTMPEGFDKNTAGIVGFPASLVTAITASTVNFTLPTTYTYSQVGSDNPNTSRVSVPMIGKYATPASGNNPKVTLKQAGAVVRFKVSNIEEGSITFTFPTKITGEVTLDTSSSDPTSWPSGESRDTETGILAANLTHEGNSITVTGVPAIPKGSYAYITVPVPTATAPQNVLVTNTPLDGSIPYRQQALPGSSSILKRADGYRASAFPVSSYEPIFRVGASTWVILAPGNLMAQIGSYSADGYATVSEWQFEEPFQFIGAATTTGNYLFAKGNSSCEGEWIDLFTYQGASATTKYQGVTRIANYTTYLGTEAGESLYTNCWTTESDNSSSPSGDKIYISNGGSYAWRPMTGAEWTYLLGQNAGTKRHGSTISETSGWYYSRATVNDVRGVLIFPDDLDWDTQLAVDSPTDKNPLGAVFYDFDSSFTATEFVSMQAKGIVFLPAAGVRDSNNDLVEWTHSEPSTFGLGRYWGSTSSGSDSKMAYMVGFESGQFYSGQYGRNLARSVRLVREVIAPLVIECDGTSFTITCGTADVDIYYETSTVDRTSVPTPTTSSTKYTGAVSISETTYVEAIATHPNYPNTAIYSMTCVVP